VAGKSERSRFRVIAAKNLLTAEGGEEPLRTLLTAEGGEHPQRSGRKAFNRKGRKEKPQRTHRKIKISPQRHRGVGNREDRGFGSNRR